MESGMYVLLENMQQDFRIGATHISLMMAILKLNEEQQKDGFVSVKGYVLRKHSKINSKSAYHKHINELHSFGYIRYLSTKGCRTGSLIQILCHS